MTQATMPDITPGQLVTLDELSRVTKIPIKTWRNWLTTGKSPLRPIKVGNLVRFRGVDVVGLIRGEIPEPKMCRRGRPTKAEQIAKQRQAKASAAFVQATIHDEKGDRPGP